MNKAEFFQACQSHDWYHDFSDDHSAWKRGIAEYQALTAAMQEMPELRPIFRAFSEYHFQNGRKPALGDYDA